MTVQGALTEIEATNLIVKDKTVTIADGVTNSLNATNAGIYIGTSNINFAYSHDVISWQSTSNLNLVATKTYKIGGTDVLSSTQVLGKSMPTGVVVGTTDFQTLSNKTILSPVMTEIVNTGTVYFPAPAVADTLVGRSTSDILTNKTINGNNNTIQNIGNNALSNSYMVINGTQRNLGDTFTVESQDPYSDEKAQDAVAGSLTNGIHTGISFAYDDTTGRINATVSAASTAPVAVGYINMNGNTPSWSGTTGYTVAKSGGDGSASGGDVFYTLTFPTAYSARTDYIVHVTYDGTDYVGSNGAQVAVERGTADVTFCTRKWNEDPLNLGDLMVTVYDL